MKKQTLVIILIAMLVVSCLALTACHSCEFGEWTVATPATCTEIGQEKRVCECGEFEVRDIPATGHTFGEWTIVKNSTCTELGQEQRVCECGEFEVRDIQATGHNYTPVVTNPSCTDGGFTTHTCSNCSDSYIDTNTQATGHDYRAVVIEPTCTTKGYTTHTCGNCNDSYADTYVDELGHDYYSLVIEPTCTTKGYTLHACANCRDKYADTHVDALGHDEIFHDAKEPTCTEVGWDSYVTCSRCDYTTYEEIPAIGHYFELSDICKRCNSKNTPNFTTPTEGYNGEKVTIIFYHAMGSDLSDILDKYIAEFNKLYPNITIVHQSIGNHYDVRDQTKIELLVGGGPNIAYCHQEHIPTFNTDYVTALDDLIASQIEIARADGTKEIIGLTQAQKDAFIAGFYNEGRAFGDGLMYTMPFSKSTEVMYYNKTFFDANNIKAPTHWWCNESCSEDCDTSLEYVLAKIKKIDPNSTPLGLDSESNWFVTMCQQLGAPYASFSDEKFSFDTAEHQSFVRHLKNWYDNGWITAQKVDGSKVSGLFVNKNSYMCIASSADATKQRPSVLEDGSYPFQVGIAQIPQMDPSNPKVISQGTNLCVLQKDNPQEVVASWLFVKYLATNPEFQAEFAMASGCISATKSAYDETLATYDADGQPTNAVATYIEYLKLADGGANITALSQKVALNQYDAYFVRPEFFGSTSICNQIEQLVKNVLLSSKTGAQLDAEIDRLFDETIYTCYFILGEPVPEK